MEKMCECAKKYSRQILTRSLCLRKYKNPEKIMEDLISKLNALKGRTIDESTIAELMRGANSQTEPQSHYTRSQGARNAEFESVDDLVVASRAAELELESIQRYFSTKQSGKLTGVDGLADEEVSSDSEDEAFQSKLTSERSYLDEVLARNSMVTVREDENDDASTAEPPSDALVSSECFASIPTTVIVPSGSCFIDLGKILSVVDGMYIIGKKPLGELLPHPVSSNEVACDVETLVFLNETDPLLVVGVVVDTLGTVENPFHLVLITQADIRTSPDTLIGKSVCTLETHANVVEIDQIDGAVHIKGAPQICDEYDGDDSEED